MGDVVGEGPAQDDPGGIGDIYIYIYIGSRYGTERFARHFTVDLSALLSIKDTFLCSFDTRYFFRFDNRYTLILRSFALTRH